MKLLRPLIALLAVITMSAMLYGCGGLNSTAESKSDSQETASEVQSTGNDASSNGASKAESEPVTREDPADNPSQEELVTVHMTVDSSRAAEFGYDNYLFKGDLQITKGTSAYDALKATGLSVSGSKTYVKSIGGLAERSCNQPGSGWSYSIDGIIGVNAASSATLNGGEVVVWKFVFDRSEIF